MLSIKNFSRLILTVISVTVLVSCASVDVPDAGSPHINKPNPPLQRFEGLNEKRDPITYVKIGKDMLVSQPLTEDEMPTDMVGPYELRGETLASALQLILDEYDVSIAFESETAFDKQITVANLRGKLGEVVNRVCSLANLYCHFEAGNLTVKDTETFVVDLPPLSNAAEAAGDSGAASSEDNAYEQIASGLEAITGEAPTVDEATRLMIYTATQRTQRYAKKYFEKLRKNTALIIYETHIWEVSLDNTNRTGIKWESLWSEVGGSNFGLNLNLPGSSGAVSPMIITPTYTGSGTFSATNVLEFISSRGAVKTVSQPQITVLSGSSASLNVSQAENFVSGMTRTPGATDEEDTVSTTTETVNTGLTMNISSAWDDGTVYGGLSIELNNLLKIEEFAPDGNTTIQLPQTTTRSLTTEIRVRPGDAILIGGIVSEKDNLEDSGPGFMSPLFSTTKKSEKVSSEIVFLLRPRVVVFIPSDADDTPQIAYAPKDGQGIKVTPLPNITKKIKGIFQTEGIAPLSELSDSVKELFSKGEKIDDKKVDKKAYGQPVRVYKPVGSLRGILETSDKKEVEETKKVKRDSGGFNK